MLMRGGSGSLTSIVGGRARACVRVKDGEMERKEIGNRNEGAVVVVVVVAVEPVVIFSVHVHRARDFGHDSDRAAFGSASSSSRRNRDLLDLVA